MHEDWLVGIAGNDAQDEWSFSLAVGDQQKLQDTLTQHWLTWITENDIQIMYEQGINHVSFVRVSRRANPMADMVSQLRIPTGFWAWIPTVSGEPYLNNQTAYHEQ